MGYAGFNLRPWSSKSSTLRELAEAEAVADSDKFTKILGMRWDPISDNIYLVQKSISTKNNTTKQAILQETAKIYDPLGFLCPLTIRAKILLQDIWKQMFDWDTPLPDDIQTQWHKSAVDLNSFISVSYPRYYFQSTYPQTMSFPLNESKHQVSPDLCIHVFCDTSLKAYGLVIYITCGEKSAHALPEHVWHH